jgi:hypothetical protein
VAARETLGDEFQQRAAFWAAVDQYRKAAATDPSLAEESNQKASQYLGLYPDNEEIFFRDLKEGDPFAVGGCINATTTVRSRNRQDMKYRDPSFRVISSFSFSRHFY